MKEPLITVGQDILQLIAEIGEFKGQWQALKTLSPERLQQWRKVATIESVGSSTRIEGAKLSDAQVETLLSNNSSASFNTRDEQEVAGYAEAMDLVFQAYEDLHLTENHVRQLHQTLLRHSTKDDRHRGSYKTLPNHVVAKDADGRDSGLLEGCRVFHGESVPASEKLVSLFEPHTEIIAKSSRKIHYGHKANLATEQHGFITIHRMMAKGIDVEYRRPDVVAFVNGLPPCAPPRRTIGRSSSGTGGGRDERLRFARFRNRSQNTSKYNKFCARFRRHYVERQELY